MNSSETGTQDVGAETPAVVFRHASARWGNRVIWEDVNAEVGRGEFVAILGPNGVGKSTLVKAVLGLFPLSSGEVLVFGEEPGEANPRIGYLPQRRHFDPGVRIRGIDVVRLGFDGDSWGFPLPGLSRFSRRHRDADARVRAVIEMVGATGYAGRPIGQISGGEQQRLLIAQALVREPDLLILDEPLDSLDLPNQAAAAALLASVSKEAGVTILMVAHNVNPILSYLDRVIYLAKGGVASGTPEEVITQETLTRLYGTPIEVFRTSDGHLVVVGQPEAPHGDVHAHMVRQ
ncbi:MAG TPA: metal ABC transporter ATP-binding protein [Tepidiformaceae bacterium]